ncbi:hypothetical protein Dimus_032744 [Dionaea muscipula]
MGTSTQRKITNAGGSPGRFIAGRRILPSSGGDDRINHQNQPNVELSDQFPVSLSEAVLGFLDQAQGSQISPNNDSEEGCRESAMFDEETDQGEEEEDEGNRGSVSTEENKSFWENHHNLLQETICKTSSLVRKIRNAAKEALKEIQKEGNLCICGRPTTATGSCRSCLLRDIARRLRIAGYNCAVCKTKWKNSPDMPSGEHTFLDVVDDIGSSKKKGVRVIIELNFKIEFEMGRASEEYKKLVARIPEAFVGRAETLNSLIKILCSAAKKCMENNKMHMGPWRKHNYMQAKWFSPCERMEPLGRAIVQCGQLVDLAHPPVKHRAPNSMLTVAMLDLMLPNAPYKVVEGSLKFCKFCSNKHTSMCYYE